MPDKWAWAIYRCLSKKYHFWACELDLAASQQNCLFPVECVPVSTFLFLKQIKLSVQLISSGHSLSCPTGYDLEWVAITSYLGIVWFDCRFVYFSKWFPLFRVDFNGRWNYLAEARCYKIKIFWKNGNGKYTETVTDARCRKKRLLLQL